MSIRLLKLSYFKYFLFILFIDVAKCLLLISLFYSQNMVKLKFFDLSWNKLTNTREDLSILRKHACNLLTLDLRHNNWLKVSFLFNEIQLRYIQSI